MRQPRFDALKHWLKTATVLFVLVILSLGLSAAKGGGVNTLLPAGNAITDGRALLRNALPIDNPPVRELQYSLEDIATQLRANRRWGAVSGDIKKADKVLSNPSALLTSIPEDRKSEAESLLTQLGEILPTLQTAAEAKKKEEVREGRSKALELIGQLEALMVQKFPYEIPPEYSTLPQLKGRATVEIVTTKGTMTAVVDGYSAPVTAGNFIDLVQRGFYNGLQFNRAEDFYILQIGDPPGKEDGFIDPQTKKYRAIPLEILVQGDAAPTYGITLEDAGRYKDLPVLPFSAYGAMALARPGDDPNGGSSQFFFFLFEPELTPAGVNLLDGRYAVFGFVTEGKEVLGQLKADDRIESIKVTQGLENLVKPNLA
jgi:peptidylprolyl isomerase